MANTLAYYNMATITAVKSFIVQAPVETEPPYRKDKINLTQKIFVALNQNSNEGKSAVSFCRQVAAWFPDMFCNFYFVKICKIGKNETTTKAGEKISAVLGSLEFRKFFDV